MFRRPAPRSKTGGIARTSPGMPPSPADQPKPISDINQGTPPPAHPPPTNPPSSARPTRSPSARTYLVTVFSEKVFALVPKRDPTKPSGVSLVAHVVNPHHDMAFQQLFQNRRVTYPNCRTEVLFARFGRGPSFRQGCCARSWIGA